MALLVSHLPAASANPQVRAYAEMICGINLNTAEAEHPEIKQRCMSGLLKLGAKALKVSGISIQRCKSKADFLVASRTTPPMPVASPGRQELMPQRFERSR